MTEPRAAGPCPPFEEACRAEAWGLGEEPDFRRHRAGCPRCRNAFEVERGLAERCRPEEIPPGVVGGFSEAVLDRTTRRPRIVGARLAWVGAGLAAAAAAYLAVTRPPEADRTEEIDLAEVDLELLEDLELAENLEVLELLEPEVLEALEEMDDA